MEAINKTQMEGIMETERLSKQTGTVASSMSNRMYKMKERISVVKVTIDEIYSFTNETIKQCHNTKWPGNMGYPEKTKTKNNKNRSSRRIPTERQRKYIQQNYRIKLSQPKEGYALKI